ncbi:TPA: hypothetical protein ACFOCA_001637, partial [Neisseria meningitidis]
TILKNDHVRLGNYHTLFPLITKARMTLKDAPRDKPKRHIPSAKQNARRLTPAGSSNTLSILHQPVLQTD